MSNYKTHSAFNILLALPVLLAGAFYLFGSPKEPLIVFACAFVYSTLFMSPDMDLAGSIKLFSLRGLLTLPFRTYSWIFTHRGVSHSIVLGSLTRVLWLAGLGLLVFYAIYQTLPSEKVFLRFYSQHKVFLWYGFAGICLADWCHLLLDMKPARR